MQGLKSSKQKGFKPRTQLQTNSSLKWREKQIYIYIYLTSQIYKDSGAIPAPFLKNIKEIKYKKEDIKQNFRKKRKKLNKIELSLQKVGENVASCEAQGSSYIISKTTMQNFFKLEIKFHIILTKNRL